MKPVDIKMRPNKDAIKLLETMIERVKSGEVNEVGLAFTTRDGSVGGDVSSGKNKFLMWAAIGHLERTFYADVVVGGA